MNPVRGAARYLAATPLPHLAAGLCLAAACALALLALHLLEAHPLEAAALGFMAAGWTGLGLVALADGLARYREFLRLQRMLAHYGFRPRILRHAAGSRCQRDAALAAAAEAGCRDEAAAYFRSLGYTPLRLVPDRVAAAPLLLLDPAFVARTFLPRRERNRRAG
ncbi:MAG: hypothetical protein AB1916_10125 [Thermodesulfobacteriota bacterium]